MVKCVRGGRFLVQPIEYCGVGKNKQSFLFIFIFKYCNNIAIIYTYAKIEKKNVVKKKKTFS